MTIGLNISGGEFGGTGGVHNKNYHYPTLAELEFYKSKGVDLVRLPFGWERMQDRLGGPLDTNGDLRLLKQVLVDAASLGMDVIIDNHNYGRFNGVALGAAGGPTAAQFADFWKKMAIELKDYPALLGYDLMNEPHDMPNPTIWKESAQAATNAIRTVDSSNTIIIEGDHWSGAHSWASSSNANLIISDPASNIVYQAHQYLDRDSSGTYRGNYDQEGAYANVGVDKLKPFVDWLNANGLKGMIGEFGVPSNDARWLDAQKKMLDYMKANNLDGTAWAGGAWWPTRYPMFTAAPGQTDSAFGNLLEGYYSQFDGFGTATAPAPAPAPAPASAPAPAPALAPATVTTNNDGDSVPSSPVVPAEFPTTPTIAGTEGNDKINGDWSRVDHIDAQGGDDSVSGVGRRDFVDGGTGNDTISYHWSGAHVDVDLLRAAQLNGDAGGDVLVNLENVNGSGHNDRIAGNDFDNSLNGLGGQDVLSGRGGSDRFVFDSVGNADGDRVTDFTDGDLLDFRSIDANSNVAGDQAFTWLNTGGFTGSAGQLRKYALNGSTYVAGDVNGDGVADFTISLSGNVNLSSGDFLL